MSKLNNDKEKHVEEQWTHALSIAALISEHHSEIIENCTKLAKATGFTYDKILLESLPKNVSEREDTNLIAKFLLSRKDQIKKLIEQGFADMEMERERRELLKGLQLTPRQMELLGIKHTTNQPTEQ